MRVSFYVMALAALEATQVISTELKSEYYPFADEEQDLAQELIQPEDGNKGMNGMKAAQVGTDGEFIGGLMSSVGGAISGVGNALGFGGRRGHHN